MVAAAVAPVCDVATPAAVVTVGTMAAVGIVPAVDTLACGLQEASGIHHLL